MKRRRFIQTVATGMLATRIGPHVAAMTRSLPAVRLGGPLFEPYDDPGQWARLLKGLGYRAAYCPVAPGTDEALIRAYEGEAGKQDIVISEVGAWSNPISRDPTEASEALEKCMAGLRLADQIGARCCVNISGSRNERYWAGPHEDNLTQEVFEMVVETTRRIIDGVKPRRSYFALEAMPWSFPDSADTYLQLIKAIDRPRFGVHLDPVNMITSPREYFNNGALIRDMFNRLGPHIRSCHAKDITLREDNYIPQLDELRAGLGNLDYRVYLTELAKLGDVPLMMEHLDTAEEYDQAARHIRSVGQSVHISI